MKRAFNTLQADLNATLRPFDLRMITFSALAVVHDNPGLNQSQLAELLGIERPNLVLIVDTLEKRGLVSRTRSEDDRRANTLALTGTGKALFDEARAAVDAHDARATAALTPSERETLIDSLHRIETVTSGGQG